ncbi:putative phage-type endonuclease [Halolactibacillus halophilus]|uniref:Putative phage-type endonuclease n=1 Tax=Halolactibacillus halophilus TaxID=306540 RepID=A0A1I5LDM0_9BACI|nr:DUF1351 domain-containing protein [Halolactibacillus halophilus]GEM00875.1 hypothetical protein HHA03_04070 [Halolactibacillus halophilus]SFO95302.1 putative phage-type endonuclease [Halolactibacillus halophilus]
MSITTQAGPNVTENRHKYIGGSDVSTILGLNKYKSVYELALEKTGIVKSEFKGNEYTEYGNIMEPQIREYVNLMHGTNFKENTRIQDNLRSNTDGYDAQYHLILEIKTHGKTATIEAYKAQMQLYMYQFECNEGWLALYERPKDFDAEFDSERLKIKLVPRDNDFIKGMLAAIKEFWEGCEYLKSHPGASEHDFYKRTVKGDEGMNELQVKTIQFEPAKVEFNYKELEAALEENLKRYEGLTFTEDDAAECKKTITELRKGKKAVDQYRLKTKKQLTAPVTAFENQCKELNKKFDEVINPLVEQHDVFENNRKEEKRKDIQEIIERFVDAGLDKTIADELVIEDSYLAKSKSLKSVEEELKTVADHLVMKREKEEADKDVIESTVEIANNRYGVNLTSAAYIHLLNHKDVKEIKTQILDDAQDEIQKQVDKEKEEKRIEELKAAKQKETEKVVEEADEPTYFELYEVIGTESQLDALEAFMRNENIEFKVKEEN